MGGLCAQTGRLAHAGAAHCGRAQSDSGQDPSTSAPAPQPCRHGRRREERGAAGRAGGGGAAAALSRRAQLAAAAAAVLAARSPPALATPPPPPPVNRLDDLVRVAPPAWPAAGAPLSLPDYTRPGPFQPAALPALEHTCAACFPECTGDRCIVRLKVVYPKGGTQVGLRAPYPLAVLSPGFLIGSEQYLQYARRLSRWGYTVVLYDKKESALDPMTDTLSAAIVTEIIDWAESDPLLRVLADTQNTLLAGHSRGAKVATLAALRDARVRALFLIDPVDVTPYAPLGRGFPSAAEGLRALGAAGRPLPVAVVGAALGGDCAPPDSNHALFFGAASAPAWEVVVQGAGHLQFLGDRRQLLQDAVCAAGAAPDEAVRELTGSMLVAWAEAMVRPARGWAGDASTSGGGPAPRRRAQQQAVRMGVDPDGNVVAGVASFDAAQALFATEGAALRLRGGAGGAGGLRVSTRLRNFSLALDWPPPGAALQEGPPWGPS